MSVMHSLFDDKRKQRLREGLRAGKAGPFGRKEPKDERRLGTGRASPAYQVKQPAQPSPQQNLQVAANRLLLSSAGAGDLKGVSAALRNGASIDARDGKGYTALTLCARKNDVKLMRALLKSNPSIDSRSDEGYTALMEAAFNGCEDAVRLLIDSHASVDAFNFDGETALMCAAASGNAAIANLLLEAKCNPNLTDTYGYTALMWAVEQGKAEAVSALARKADVERRSKDTLTPLMRAAKAGDCAIAEILLSHGAELGCCSKESYSPLMYAIKEGRAEMVRLLIRFKADVNDTTLTDSLKERTPLSVAVRHGQDEIAAMLRKHGARI